jgi:hypothetical protein
MKVKIYRPTKNTMQSGKANTKFWLLEPMPESERFIEPIMGWTASGDTPQQLRLKFPTKEKAIEFAQRAGHDYVVVEPKLAQLQRKSYAENFK